MSDDNSSVGSASSSSSSDDEFLASSGIGPASSQDREALVRKKLLESFYGASAVRDEDDAHHVESTEDATNEDSDSEEDNHDPILQHPKQSSYSSFQSPSEIPLPFTATKSDLDSPSFRPTTHTLSHIAHSSAQTLLETDERLALDIRHLDSTMQTLVYENYSKFINATDAIKSIGTNVTTTGAASLDRLQLAMDRIKEASERSEKLLRASREAVAEKLRIQRLLIRLEALLCLPATLRSYISKQQWRMAVKSHKNATEILGRHSAGFESLRCIEEECSGILKELVVDLKDKLLRWSGRGGTRSTTFSSDGLTTRTDAESITEIFECAGTLLMLYNTVFCPGLDGSECRKLALEACANLLKERLAHIGPDTSMVNFSAGTCETSVKPGEVVDEDHNTFELPILFLDGLLEATTLYSVSFRDSSSSQESDRDLIEDFVTTNFDKFIARVRAILFVGSTKHNSNSPEDQESNEDAKFYQISIALSNLIHSVRELASGLALPEVGLNLSIASALVDQTVELTEMLVKRRVTVKFCRLREVVVKDCMAPLVKKIIDCQYSDGREEEESKSPLSLVEMIQLANVALSDSLQMADDLIRATLQRSESSADGSRGMVAPIDSAVVKLAVQMNSRLFAVWLASSLEVLAGCESCDSNILLDVRGEINEDNESNNYKNIDISGYQCEEEYNGISVSLTGSLSIDEPTTDTYASAFSDILLQINNEATTETYSNFILAVCEMCRLAERSIANTLNQSIQSAMEEPSRVAESADTLFAADLNPSRKDKGCVDTEMILAQRFKLAASRALSLYIMNRGALAASELYNGMHLFSDTRDAYAIPTQPREECLKVFEVVKVACEDCITIMGGDLFSAPVTPFPEDQEYSDVFGSRMTQHADKGAAARGLQLDVERMFIEKTQVYPHSSDELNFTRNAVVSGIFRVTLSAFLECVRSSVFSSLGYRQMKVDAILIRYLLPHFVSDEFGTPEANACTSLFNILDDIMLKAGQRCVDSEVVGDDDYYDADKDEIVTPYYIVRQFLMSHDGDDSNSNVMKKIAFV